MLTIVISLGDPMDRGAWWGVVHGVVKVGHDLVTKASSLLFPLVLCCFCPYNSPKPYTSQYLVFLISK